MISGILEAHTMEVTEVLDKVTGRAALPAPIAILGQENDKTIATTTGWTCRRKLIGCFLPWMQPIIHDQLKKHFLLRL